MPASVRRPGQIGLKADGVAQMGFSLVALASREADFGHEDLEPCAGRQGGSCGLEPGGGIVEFVFGKVEGGEALERSKRTRIPSIGGIKRFPR